MTEDQARAICAKLGATFSIRMRKGSAYVYVSRWLPRAAAEAARHQASSSNGQQFDRYVGPLDRLAQIDADTLKERIASLPLTQLAHPNFFVSGVAPRSAAPGIAVV